MMPPIPQHMISFITSPCNSAAHCHHRNNSSSNRKMQIKHILTGLTATALIASSTTVFATPIANPPSKTQLTAQQQWEELISKVNLPPSSKRRIKPRHRRIRMSKPTPKPKPGPKEIHGHSLCCQAHIDIPWHKSSQPKDLQSVKGALEELMAAGTNPIILKDEEQLMETMIDAQSSIGLRCSPVDDNIFNGTCSDPREYKIRCYKEDAIMDYTKMRVGVDCKTPTNNRPLTGYAPNWDLENLDMTELLETDPRILMGIPRNTPLGEIAAFILAKHWLSDSGELIVDWGPWH